MRWVYLAIVIVFVAALIIFVLQNTQASTLRLSRLGSRCRSPCLLSSSTR